MIKSLIRQFAGGASSGRRRGGHRGGYRRGRGGHGSTGGQIGRMVESFLRRRR